MNRKSRRPAGIEPPQLAPDMPAVDDIAELEARASYTQQVWAAPQCAAQSAEDVSFDQLDVRGGSFNAAELPLLQMADCRFDTTDFASCALEKAYVRRAEFVGCRLVGLQIGNADLADVRFVRCNARLLRCWESTAKSLRFEHCALQEASFDGSDLSGAVFAHCDLSGADFRNARLKGADLRGSTIAGIKLNSRDIAGAIIDPGQALELIQLFGVVVRSEEE